MRYLEFLPLNEEKLIEIDMSPSALTKAIKKIPGALAGLEFEMIVPYRRNSSDSDSEEQTEDYDEDRRPRSIEDVCEFFGRQGINFDENIARLKHNLEESYFDWREEQIREGWLDQGYDYFKNYVKDESFDSDWEDEFDSFEEYVQSLWDEGHSRIWNQAFDSWRDELFDIYTERQWFMDEQIDRMREIPNLFNYAGCNVIWPYWTSITNISPSKAEIIPELALNFMNHMGQSVIAYATSYKGDIHIWDRGNNRWINTRGKKRPDDMYIIEPDGSLEPPDEDAEMGLEFVSPPMHIDDMIDDIGRVADWMDSVGAKTRKDYKTGLHMNISVPDFDKSKLDYVKMALLLGDKHILKKFDRLVVGRFEVNYAESALEKIEQAVIHNPSKAKALLDKMRGHIEIGASKALHNGDTDKYTSINVQDNRVEIRSIGGDWKGAYRENPDNLVSPLKRFVVALDAACDPTKYNKEFQSKLFKILTRTEIIHDKANRGKFDVKIKNPKNEVDVDTIKYFTQYAANVIPLAALKSFVRHAQLKRSTYDEGLGKENWLIYNMDNGKVLGKFWAPNESKARTIATNMLIDHGYRTKEERADWDIVNMAPNYEIYDMSGGPTDKGHIFYADSKQEASKIAKNIIEKYGLNPLKWAMRHVNGGEQRKTIWTRPIATEYFTDHPTNPNGDWVLYTEENDDSVKTLYRFAALNKTEASSVVSHWLAAHPWHHAEIKLMSDSAKRLGQPGTITQISALPRRGEFTGEWKIVDGAGDELHRFSNVGNSQAEANAVATRWAGINRYSGALEVLPIMAD